MRFRTLCFPALRCRYVRASLAVVIAVAVAPFVPADAGEITIEQILSAPFPSDLVASPSGTKVAWAFNSRGVRNIWVAEAPEFQARQITKYDKDDGIEITDLRWAMHESSLVYVRGGAPNRNGELPNPRSDSDGVERDIWQVQVDSGQPIRLDKGHSPLVHPDGQRLVYIDDGDVKLREFQAKAEAGAAEEAVEAESETILEARGGIHSLRWSPDGSKLAFVSVRRDHSFVGVLDLASELVRWMTPTIDRDSDPVWSPDGKSIAFIRLPTKSETFIFSPDREGYPWAIHVADAATGQGRKIWQAERGRGSVFHPLDSEANLLWIGDRIVFPWERDGWTQLYSVSTAGGSPKLLTPGDFEVEHVAIGLDDTTIYYSSNQDDIDRRHLWSVRVGETPKAVTAGAGIEWSPAPLADGAIALLASDSRLPAHVRIVDASGTVKPLATSTLPRDFPHRELVDPEPVVFTAADGMEIRGQLFLPRTREVGKRYPAAIFFHGGSRRQMLLGWHSMNYYHNTYGFNQYLASQGYVVLSVNYRSGTGYGLEFREAEDYGASGASEFNDVLGAGLYLKNRSDVDPDRIALWGGSYGGYLTAMGLARASDLFACGVDIHGVHDWNDSIHNFIPEYNPLENPERARLAFESSPLADLDEWRSPVLLISGDDDRNVNIHQSVRLTEALRARDVHVEHLVFPDEVHGFLLYSNWLKALTAADEFMKRQMAH